MKKGLFLILFALLVVTVQAADFSVTATPVKNYVLTTDIGKYNITITNLKPSADHFSLEPLQDLRFVAQSVPTYIIPSGIDISGHNSSSFILLLNPSDTLADGTYTLALAVHSEKEDATIKTALQIHLGEHESMYEPDVIVEPNIPEKIDPRQISALKIALKNQNIISYDNLSIEIIGDVIHTSTITTLNARESKTINIPIDLPKDSKPRTETVRIKVSGKNTVFLDKEFTLNILAYSEPFEKNESIQKKFLKTIREINLTNPANAKETKEFRLETTARERLFTSTTPPAKVVREEDKQYYVWAVTLDPKETITITITKSYRLFTFLVITLIIGLIYYYLTRSPLVIRKEVVKVHYDKDAVVSGVVRMYLRNRTGKAVHNVKIIERLPSMFLVDKHAFKNTLEPTKIFSTHNGPVMEYHLKTVDPHEDRIITYGFKTKLNVVGEHTIPATKMTFKDHQGYKFVVSSNALIVGKKESSKN